MGGGMAAALAAAAVVATIIVVGGDDGGGVAGDDSADVTESGAWGRVSDDAQALGGVGNQEIVAVAASESALVAVGSDDSGGDDDAAVWLSTDGSSWSRVAHDESVFGGAGQADQRMTDVAAGPSGFVAVGTDAYGSTSSGAVWISPDGHTWERVDVPHAEIVDGRPNERQEMHGVVAGGPGYVAVGSDRSFGADAAVWASPDGQVWTRVPNEGDLVGGYDLLQMRAVEVRGTELIAVGAELGGFEEAVVWTSSDSLAWHRAPRQEGLGGGVMLATSTEGSIIVAVGLFDDVGPSAKVWSSQDAIHWTTPVENDQVFGDGFEVEAQMSAVVGGEAGYVAVGAINAGDEDTDAAVWSSPDGIQWTVGVPFVVPGDQLMKDLVRFGGRLFAVGVDGARGVGDDDAAVWISTGGSG